MSDETQAAFRDAYDAHMRARKDATMLGENPDSVDKEPLAAAAQAHVEGSPPWAEVKAEFERQATLRANGETDDEHYRAEVAAEEAYAWLSTATAILAGAPLAATIGG